MLKIKSLGDVTEVSFDKIQKLNVVVCDTVKTGLQTLFERPNEKVLINMEGIHFIDSSGFAVFLSVLKAAGRTGGQMIFCNISHSAMELFRVLQLHTIFNIINDREEALKSFSQD